MIMLPQHSQQLCTKTVFHKPYNHKQWDDLKEQELPTGIDTTKNE